MKYFCVADPHGFFTIMKQALDESGFDATNPDHKLVIAGDLLDRGKEPLEMIDYVKSLGDKLIFIRGNHEDLLIDCYEEMKKYYRVADHHVSNGTLRTIKALLDISTDEDNKVQQYIDFINEKCVDYFETEHYIFVHGWIPLMMTAEDNFGLHYYDNWRNPIWPDEWPRARWYNGMNYWKRGENQTGKTIVCGHYHCGYGNVWLHNEEGDEALLSDHPFIDDGIIALDAATVVTKKVNVVVLED